MQRRLVIAGLAATLAAPVAVIQPASASILFTCDSVTGSAVLAPGLVHNQRAESFSSGPTAPAGPQDIVLASTSDAGVKGGQSEQPTLSGDGTKVAFISRAINLDPADTDTLWDVYVKDLSTGDITLASTSDAGVKGNRDATTGAQPRLALSADGTRVAFTTFANNLDPVDTDTLYDVYVKDLSTGDIALASTSDLGVKGNADSATQSLSADGTKVAFKSDASNLDPADSTGFDEDVYVKNLSTGDITLASTSDTGVKGNDSLGTPARARVSLSADGTKVAFESDSTNLDPADTDGEPDIYVKNLTTGDITLASTSDTGIKGNGASYWPSLSADGTKVAFASSTNNLDPRGGGVFVKDLSTGDITLTSTSDTGVNGNDNGNVPSLSGDGTRVAFDSYATNLDPTETEFDLDVFVKNLGTDDLTLASTSDTGVKDNGEINTQLPRVSLSADGTKVAFFSSATNLDPADADTSNDVYVKELPTVPTSIGIDDCSNGQTGTASIVDIRSYGARPLGCPVSLGGASGNDYSDQTPMLLGSNPSLRIDWASGPDSFGVAKMKMGTTGTQWRAVLAIQASPGHDTPATNQYLPAAGSGLTKTKLKGRVDWSALDSFNCTSGIADPLSWLDMVNNGGWIAKNQ